MACHVGQAFGHIARDPGGVPRGIEIHWIGETGSPVAGLGRGTSAAPEAAHLSMKASRFWPMPGSIVAEHLTFGRVDQSSIEAVMVYLLER
jgi:hypothetical protein